MTIFYKEENPAIESVNAEMFGGRSRRRDSKITAWIATGLAALWATTASIDYNIDKKGFEERGGNYAAGAVPIVLYGVGGALLKRSGNREDEQ